jgi:hypothetical protein
VATVCGRISADDDFYLTLFSDGPSFYDYFYNQNLAIQNGSVAGCALNMDTLGIINGIIDEGEHFTAISES